MGNASIALGLALIISISGLTLGERLTDCVSCKVCSRFLV